MYHRASGEDNFSTNLFPNPNDAQLPGLPVTSSDFRHRSVISGSSSLCGHIWALVILCEGRRIPEGSERLIDFAFFGPCKAHSERCGPEKGQNARTGNRILHLTSKDGKV